MSEERIGLKSVKTVDLTKIDKGPIEFELRPLQEESMRLYGLMPNYVRLRVDGTKHNKEKHGGKRLIFYSSSEDERSELYVGLSKICSLEHSIVGLEGTDNGDLGDYLFGKIITIGPGYYLEIPYKTTKLRLEAWRNGKGNQSLAYFTFLNGQISNDLEESVPSLSGNELGNESDNVGRLETYFNSLKKQP